MSITQTKLNLEVGKTYVLQNNLITTITKIYKPTPTGSHDTAQDKFGHNWYNRLNNIGDDNGRVSGTNHDYSYPLNIKIENGEFVEYNPDKHGVLLELFKNFKD